MTALRRFLPLAALSLALIACAPADGDKSAAASRPATPAPKKAASPEKPTLKIATVDGAQYDLASKRGRWVVVNFWATWCAPCLKEMPEIDAFGASRKDVDVIGLAYEEIDPKEMRDFLAKHAVRYPIAVVDTYDPPADFPTPRGLPTTYVIAPDGRIAKTFLGPITGADLAAVVGAAKG